jgi:hypothetical protein
MDELKKYAGYAGLGFVGGYLGITLTIMGDFAAYRIYRNIFDNYPILFMVFFHILGGVLGGILAKKWWGAFGVGFILGLISF